MRPQRLLILGNGYSGQAIAKLAAQKGFVVRVTSRTPAPGLVDFADAGAAIAEATHIISTAAPDEQGDPVLNRYKTVIQTAPNLRYIGYLSTTGVYGNRDGGWVDEDTPPAPNSPRAQRRVEAETAWQQFSVPTDIFRLAGIYGPGRSMFDDLREGTARRLIKPGHLFGRIHRDDIASGVLAAMQTPGTGRKFNFSDDEPAASADVVVFAAGLLNMPPPDPVPYEEAFPKMSAMARSFWAENRRVANAKTKAALNLSWAYPTYREGLRAILAEETGQGCA